MTVLDELQAAVGATAERVGPSVVGLGRGWGRGSGVVDRAASRVLTNAHVLRGDEVAVTRADGEVVHGRVAGADADLDVAVIEVDTGAAPAVALGARARRRGAAGPARLRARRPGRPRAARLLRPRHRDGPLLPRPARAPHRRLDRALGAAAARLLRRAAGRRRGPPARAQHGADGGRADARAARPTRRCARRVDALARGEAPARPRLGVALAPPRAARRLRAAVGLPERDGLLVRGVEDGSPAAAAGLERGDLLVAAGGRAARRLRRPLRRAGGARAARSTLTVVRGTEEREVRRARQPLTSLCEALR